ncbi:MAG: hypothetical protein FJZ87_04315 [Chloroflexi bacterium]|nr:hypothetical protein [Chloroflexota bacterium]
MVRKKTEHSELSAAILAEEFEYIASTAGQSNEDRARVSSFYLVAVGSLVAALFSTQLIHSAEGTRTLQLLFAGLFLILTLLGTLTVMQLARLRAAWHESMSALNQIKEFTIQRDKLLAKAFRWRASTMPPLYKVNSISYLQTLEVALLSGLTFGAAVFFLQAGAGYDHPVWIWTFALSAALFSFFLQLMIYKRFLRK